ncbi:AAA domain-containing protein [Dysgonomonas alginatilytica]|uniref:AAA domain-containing protein n=1 Tax=Dysgonomonas alginatilytica TaxID=1605892 RepID=A0A2V3PH64_9BACT|nr:DUF3320 domain-containing protein [Dysgonomonas alginatilytica]PXV57132.1 AAA domain-containing protein [Dysgonomonas alginatilytica]
MANIKIKIEAWKKLLLDLGKRNRLINFKETKRSNIAIELPSFDDLFDAIVSSEKSLKFPFAKKIIIDDGEETFESIIEGDLKTNKTPGDLQKTLKVLRAKAKMSIEEQGINTLYLTFGLLKWKETSFSEQIITSPLVLVPVTLTNESISSPYIMHLHEDEVVVNPTLSFKLNNDFGIELPEFDADKMKISSYIEIIREAVQNEDWKISCDANLTLLSFLKINMYKDLERNEEKLINNPIVSAIAGDGDPIYLSEEYNDFDHDTKIRPVDTYQVVDADSSQQDAILLSKNNVSFVLQGPPGTGKSQTITNIISEALADGKKVLFVSEKMAALQVVHKRLTQVGLSDFCLTLHSHKANKKEILRELANSLSMNKVSVKEEAVYKLMELEYLRERINKYHKELHTKCLPLNKSIYEVNGILASLDNLTEIIFDIAEVDKFTPEKLNTHKYLLEVFSKTIGKMSESFHSNPWYNSTVDNVSFELRHDIDANFKTLIPLLKELVKEVQDTINEFELSLPISINQIDNLIEILNLSNKSPKIPIHWITDNDICNLIKQTTKYKQTSDEIRKSTSNLTKKYGDKVLLINGGLLNAEISEALSNIKLILNHQTYESSDSIVDGIDIIIKEAEFISNDLDKLFILVDRLSIMLGIQTPNKFSEISNFATITEILSTRIIPTRMWFENIQNTDFELFLAEASTIHNEENTLLVKLFNNYDKEILDIDFNSIIKRYRTDYRSIFRIFNSQYRKDKRDIQALCLSSEKLNDNTIITLLDQLKVIAEKKSWINEHETKLREYFGVYYKGLSTDWGKLLETIGKFRLLIELLPEQIISTLLRSLLINDELPYEKITSFISLYSTIDINQIIATTERLIDKNINAPSGISKLIKLASGIVSQADTIKRCYNEVNNLTPDILDSKSFFADLNELSNIQIVLQSIDSKKEFLQQQYSFLWKGDITDWDTILFNLEFADKFIQLVDKHTLPARYIERICSDTQSINLAGIKSLEITKIRLLVGEELEWVFNMFDESEDLSNKKLEDIIKRFTECYTKKSSLEEWIDYRNNRKKCKEAGLAEYISKIECLNINPNLIIGTYLKRFYRLWLDKQLPNYPTVQSFRHKSHESNLSEFKILDRGQMVVAQSRVRERLLSRLPDFNSITSSRDEIGILKRELNKQRKLLPLRKLFNAIPNLLTSLKPCFMMSPLSVSVFLEAQSYEFDLIIFDEASQVCTEDAVGAIMRGKQVIVVGDSKQLPPTNFFATTLSDGDYDIESDEQDDTGAYESILDEALNAIPERSLRWHYRSRHEHLIAFSNAKIYNHKLITFPSHQEKVKDFGVEYVYVPNGVYDRGGKRNNIIEANKVADLVLDHFRTNPNRSLGVVTFSEAQQQAVDMAIRERRLSNSSFDIFFAEEKEEAFFIKNLENVQGDERDTIIFSIGYAKDSKGIMYMSFGPLSRDGGYRRLNVAITRAKYNIKLIGSILPADIDTERTTSEGVKMLRSYIDFAQNGMSALEGELKYNDILELDSPFEESVYDFLNSKGYNVVTQVGCSGFRIDMAIRHQKHTGVFVLGIECDGATYHSSRTARERDRLRQTILEDMGWRIYRIWSTDWIKDQITESERLIDTIEKVLREFEEPKLDLKIESIDSSSINIEIEEQLINQQQEDVGYGFSMYEEANIDDVERVYDDWLYASNVVKHILQIEQPIHFENLCKRIAPLWGNQKATSKIRELVNYTINRHLKNQITNCEDFISLTSVKSITVRIPNSEYGDNIRPVQYIATEELAEAMVVIAQRSYGIRSEDLKIATAREFGFSRKGSNITQAMEKAYYHLHTTGRIQEIDDSKVKVLIN